MFCPHEEGILITGSKTIQNRNEISVHTAVGFTRAGTEPYKPIKTRGLLHRVPVAVLLHRYPKEADRLIYQSLWRNLHPVLNPEKRCMFR